MAEISAQFVLTTPGPSITFNAGPPSQFYLTDIQGLDGVQIRAPIDNAPQAHGGLIHNFWKGPRHISIQGILLIQLANQDLVLTARNTMEANLISALENILQADGTLAWTPLGQAARSLAVRNDVPLQFGEGENSLVKTFTFGLVAGTPDW